MPVLLAFHFNRKACKAFLQRKEMDNLVYTTEDIEFSTEKRKDFLTRYV